MSDEADLSAEQPGAGAPPRLPVAHGDGGRPLGGPGAPGAGPQEAVRVTAIAPAKLALAKLAKRRDFLAANKGRRAPTPGFVLLVHPRRDGDPAVRLGITVTKKIGNAVVRNRMKRRFRALGRELLPVGGVPGADHVLIGRTDGVERPFATLRTELSRALAKMRR